MINLVRIVNNSIIWPYSLTRLQLDEPTQSISLSPNRAELAYYSCFKVEKNDPPIIDPSIEKVIEVTPVNVDGKWIQQWQIVPLTEEEKREYYKLTHPPRWLEFGQAVQANPDINVMLGQALTAAPALAMALSIGLGKAADGDSRMFVGAWKSAVDLNLVSQELIETVKNLAIEYDISEEFIVAISGEG